MNHLYLIIISKNGGNHCGHNNGKTNLSIVLLFDGFKGNPASPRFMNLAA
jgi:hypothetical protein